MRVQLNKQEEAIDIGDVIIDELDNAYFICRNPYDMFPIKVVGLQSGRIVNGFKDIKHVNGEAICEVKIVKVIKNSNLIITEAMEEV